jgi:transmembrane sensor
VRPPLGLWPSLGRVMSDLGADYRTGIGGRRRVTIAKGVSVEMNTDTGLALRGRGQGEAVELIHGEVAVEARGDGATPFVVAALNGRSLASKASFNVRYGEAGVRVACVRGEMRVECMGRTVALGAGREVAYDREGLGDPRAVDAAVVTAWRSGLLVFRDAPLREVIAEINRYRPGKLILTRADLGRRPIFGVFHIDRLDDGIATLSGMTKLQARSLPGGIVLLS